MNHMSYSLNKAESKKSSVYWKFKEQSVLNRKWHFNMIIQLEKLPISIMKVIQDNVSRDIYQHVNKM